MSSSGREGHSSQQFSTSSTALSLQEKQKYIEAYEFPFCDESSKYEKVAKIGQGTFGYAQAFAIIRYCGHYNKFHIF